MSDNREKLMTASDVAALCQVDLKTIHNWVDRGEIPHFRTPGRHLRFRSADVVGFLRRHGYPVPAALEHGHPKNVLVVGGPDTVALIRSQLAVETGAAEVASVPHPYDALVAAGAGAITVFVVDGAVGTGVDLAAVFEALHRARPDAALAVVGDVTVALPPFVKRYARDSATLAA